jgi:hypothetical protein
MQKAGGSGAGGATYALKGDGAAVRGVAASVQALVSGDKLKITFRNTEASGGINTFLTDGDIAGSTRAYFAHIATTELIGFIAASATCEYDGVPISDATELFPTDGVTHELELTATANLSFYNVFTNYLVTLFSKITLIQIQTTTVARGVETWNFNTRSLTVIEEEGTGVDINLSGVVAEDWVKL